MDTRADKIQTRKSHSAANASAQRPAGVLPATPLVDNRPEALAQRTLQEHANNNVRVKQLRAFQDMARERRQLKSGRTSSAAVVQRIPRDFQIFSVGFKEYTAWVGKNVWDLLKLAIDDYFYLGAEEYLKRKEHLEAIEVAVLPCYKDVSGWSSVDEKKAAQIKLSRFNSKLNDEKIEVSNALRGNLDLLGQVIPATNEPTATAMAQAATIPQGTQVFLDKTLLNPTRLAKLDHDKTAMGGGLKAFPIVDCFVIEKTMNACKIAYWEKKVYTQPGQELIETKQDRVDGWVNKGACEIDNLMGNTVVELLGAQNVDKRNQPLFPNKPSQKDIVQVGLADCYFLAPIAGFVDKNPSIIEDMMKDNGDGTVTVRFYDIISNGMAGRNYMPRYIKINKSVVQVNGINAYAHGALWVQLMEKAFAAAGYTGKLNALNLPKIALQPSYGEIEFGHAEIAMEHILGKAANVRLLNTEGGVIPQNISAQVPRLPWAIAEIQDYNIHKLSINKNQDYQALASFAVFGGDIGKIDTWFTFLNQIGGDLDKTVQDQAQKGDLVAAYKAELRLEDFRTCFVTKNLNPGVRSVILKWLVDHKIYPGKRGTSLYSNSQIAAFSDIVTYLQTNHAVVLSSREKIARNTTNIGASGGEEMAKGLAGKHVYTVLDYGFGDAKNKNQHSGPQRWLKIRNPWAQYGRNYVKPGNYLKTQEVEGGNGVFWLELSDVTKRFKSAASIDLT